MAASGFATSPTVTGRPTPSSSRSPFRRIVDAAKEVRHSMPKAQATLVGNRVSAAEFDVFAQQPSSYLLCCADGSCTYCGISRTVPLRMLCAHSEIALISSASAYSSIAFLSFALCVLFNICRQSTCLFTSLDMSVHSTQPPLVE